MPVIGFLSGGSAWEYARAAAAFRQGLSETGYVEGRNVPVEYRWAEGQYDRLAGTGGRSGSPTGDRDRRRIPGGTGGKGGDHDDSDRLRHGADPVAAGLVASLNRPGGNLTGVTRLNVELGPKRLELLHELVPTATVMAVLVNPTNPHAETQSRDDAGGGP